MMSGPARRWPTPRPGRRGPPCPRPGGPLELVSVTLASNQRLSDADLEKLQGLSELTTLHLAGTRVGDAGLKHLKGLPRLETLNLKGTRVGDAGLEALKAFPKITG